MYFLLFFIGKKWMLYPVSINGGVFYWEEMDAVSRFNKRRWLTMKTTKQKRLFMLVPVWLLLFGLLLWAGTASAGSNPMHVAVKKGNVI